MTKRRHTVAMTVGAVLAMTAACSVVSDGPIGSSSAKITVLPNAPAVLLNMHYADVVAAKFPGAGQWHWVAAFDNCSSGATTDPGYFHCDTANLNNIGWAFSTDLTGTMWTPIAPPTGSEPTMWGSPGVPSGGGTFTGWGGDSTLATIGNPPDGTHVLMATLAISSLGGPSAPSDIATLLSSDGGQTWGNPKYISQPVGGAQTDQPQIVSNSSAPFSTFVAWQNNTNSIPSTAWFTSINNVTFMPGSSSSAPNTWDVNSPTGNKLSAKRVFNAANNSYIRPKMAVGNVQGCTNGPHEVVYFAWSDDDEGHGKCHLNPNTTESVTWKMTFFDNTMNVWAPQLYVISTDPSYPRCIGGGTGLNNDNLPEPSLATDGNTLAIVHNHSSALGTRIEIDDFVAACSGTTVNGGTALVRTSPDPCYIGGLPQWCPPGHTGGNGSGGTNVINDQWGPHAAYQLVGTTEYLLVTWYDTSGDLTNSHAKINGAINTSGVIGNPFYVGTSPTIYQVSLASGSGQTIPWDNTLRWADWYDYQGIGVDTINHRFLSAWGGDARLAAGSGVWTAVVTTP